LGIHAFEISSTSLEVKEIDLSVSNPAVTDTDKASLHLYLCNANSCVKTNGYVRKDATNVYKIATAGSDVVTPASDCTAVGSILQTSFKMCIDTDVDHAVDFETGQNSSNYIMNVATGNIFTNADSDSIIVRSSKNVFYQDILNGTEKKFYPFK